MNNMSLKQVKIWMLYFSDVYIALLTGPQIRMQDSVIHVGMLSHQYPKQESLLQNPVR